MLYLEDYISNLCWTFRNHWIHICLI